MRLLKRSSENALYQRPPKGKSCLLREMQGWWQAQDEALKLKFSIRFSASWTDP